MHHHPCTEPERGRLGRRGFPPPPLRGIAAVRAPYLLGVEYGAGRWHNTRKWSVGIYAVNQVLCKNIKVLESQPLQGTTISTSGKGSGNRNLTCLAQTWCGAYMQTLHRLSPERVWLEVRSSAVAFSSGKYNVDASYFGSCVYPTSLDRTFCLSRQREGAASAAKTSWDENAHKRYTRGAAILSYAGADGADCLAELAPPGEASFARSKRACCLARVVVSSGM